MYIRANPEIFFSGADDYNKAKCKVLSNLFQQDVFRYDSQLLFFTQPVASRKYTDSHEWIAEDGNGVIKVGVSAYAQVCNIPLWHCVDLETTR
jgi:hypothetical protein